MDTLHPSWGGLVITQVDQACLKMDVLNICDLFIWIMEAAHSVLSICQDTVVSHKISYSKKSKSRGNGYVIQKHPISEDPLPSPSIRAISCKPCHNHKS